MIFNILIVCYLFIVFNYTYKTISTKYRYSKTALLGVEAVFLGKAGLDVGEKIFQLMVDGHSRYQLSCTHGINYELAGK